MVAIIAPYLFTMFQSYVVCVYDICIDVQTLSDKDFAENVTKSYR